MSGKKHYFANKWQKFKDAPPEMFHRHMFIEVMDGLVDHWEILPHIDTVIRATHLKTKKVTEHVYKRKHAAENKVISYLNKRTHEFIICQQETLHYVHPNDYDAVFDELFDDPIDF
jgi:hypothetical protein